MEKLKLQSDGLYITRKKQFKAIGTLKTTTVQSTLDFAYDMSFGSAGEHRNHRSGGIHSRKNGEIFANTFQGKLSEFAIYNILYKNYDIEKPDLSTYGLGEWDACDFVVNNKKISVKSTKSFGNLLLLETKDWNAAGQYIPNIEKGSSDYDIFILVRMNPFCEDILKRNKLLYSQNIDKKDLSHLILGEDWEYDIPGFILKEDLIYAINNKFIIGQGQYLNGKTIMDAENYYVQAGDMRNIEKLSSIIG